MSTLQEYKSIKTRMDTGEFEAIEKYLIANPHILLSDLYYNEERYKAFFIWWKDQELDPTIRYNEIVVSQETKPSSYSVLKWLVPEYMVQVYVDGSFTPAIADEEKGITRNDGTTGAGIVIILNKDIYKKSFRVKTEKGHSWNIDGECHAALEALKICSGMSPIENTMLTGIKNITINYDYLGIEKWITGEWKIKSKISKVYAKEFNKLLESSDINVTFNKIKAHSGDKFNEIADGLAREATIL